MSSQNPPVTRYPDEFEELDFEIINEYWNEYELSDGITIKARTLLKKIVIDPNEPDKYAFDLQPIISAVYAPLALRGEKNNAPKPEEYNTIANYEVEPKRSDEKFNVYRILKSGHIFKLKLVITKFSRLVDRFDKDGLPFYILNHGPMVVMEKNDKQTPTA